MVTDIFCFVIINNKQKLGFLMPLQIDSPINGQQFKIRFKEGNENKLPNTNLTLFKLDTIEVEPRSVGLIQEIEESVDPFVVVFRARERDIIARFKWRSPLKEDLSLIHI